MSLQPYKITALSKTDSGGSNIIPNAPVAIVNGSGGYQALYESDLTTPIANPATADANGELEVWIEPGYYTVAVSGGQSWPIIVGMSVDRKTSYADIRSVGATYPFDTIILSSEGIGGTFRLDPTDSTSADDKGTIIVDSAGRRWKRLELSGPTPLWFGCAADGVTVDDAGFSDFESVYQGITVDLSGFTFAVTSVPKKNGYINGNWVSGSRVLESPYSDAAILPVAKCARLGGQLAKLKKDLCDPFKQIVGIAFLGDSITWGSTLPENLNPGSDLTTLATRRDLFVSPSFVNEFKRWVGRNFADDSTPVISNWPASTAGEAIAEYTKEHLTYPNRDPFSVTNVGSASISDVAAAQSVTGYQASMAASAGANSTSFSFTFTGSSFDIVFTCVDSDAWSYEVIVDGGSIGTFDTSVAAGFVDGSYGNVISHSFSYVRDKIVEVKLSGSGAPSIRRLRVEAVRIPKIIRITNQGISGSNSTRYYNRALTTAFLPDIAVTEEDLYAFVQLGTNDRLDSTWPNGVNSFGDQMNTIFDVLDPLCDSIVMCANHVGESNQAGKRITMQEIRAELFNIAHARSYDFIDNYSIFDSIDPSVSLADNLHPNRVGHYMIFRNIVNSLEGG